MNIQELEGLQFSNIQISFYNNKSLLTSANNYIAILFQIMDNVFVKGWSNIFEKDQDEDILYHFYIFREYTKGWIDCRFDQDLFVLVHNDLEFFNLIINKNMNIILVLDWEWSRVIPL
jgi:hypothetical protein